MGEIVRHGEAGYGFNFLDTLDKVIKLGEGGMKIIEAIKGDDNQKPGGDTRIDYPPVYRSNIHGRHVTQEQMKAYENLTRSIEDRMQLNRPIINKAFPHKELTDNAVDVVRQANHSYLNEINKYNVR
jgi:hypothetical protein